MRFVPTALPGVLLVEAAAHGLPALWPQCNTSFNHRRGTLRGLHYQAEPMKPEAARGVRWNDPAFAVDWPFEPAVISARDAGLPDFTPSGLPDFTP